MCLRKQKSNLIFIKKKKEDKLKKNLKLKKIKIKKKKKFFIYLFIYLFIWSTVEESVKLIMCLSDDQPLFQMHYIKIGQDSL